MGTARINGYLSVSRALGDAQLIPYVSSEPDIFVHTVEKGDVCILACDGVWDVITEEDVEKLVRIEIESSTPHLIAQKIMQRAYKWGSQDNISVIAIMT